MSYNYRKTNYHHVKVIKRAVVPFPPDQATYSSKTFPAMEVLPSGRWLAACKVADKKTDSLHKKVLMTWSDDRGETWAPAFEPVAIPRVNGTSGQAISAYFLATGGDRVLMLLNWVDETRPDLPFYDPKDESLKDTRIFYSFSSDAGMTWSSPTLMDTTALGGPVPLTGPPMLLGDGSILCQFEINKYKGDPNPWIHRSALIRSVDGGQTWTDPVYVTNYPGMYYWDQRPNVLQDGQSLVNYFWTLDGKLNEYLNIHESVSKDGGRSWSVPADTHIYGQPGRPLQLPDRRIIGISIDRTSVPTIYLHVKDSLDTSFVSHFEIYRAELPKQDSRYVTMNDAWEEMAKFSVGHPNLVHIGGTLLMAYYYCGEHHDRTEIAYCLLSLE
jgi:hypothetical protein